MALRPKIKQLARPDEPYGLKKKRFIRVLRLGVNNTLIHNFSLLHLSRLWGLRVQHGVFTGKTW